MVDSLLRPDTNIYNKLLESKDDLVKSNVKELDLLRETKIQNNEGLDIIQVSGDANTGKSEFALNMIVNCILPFDCDGNNSPCILFDFDGNIQSKIKRIVSILQTILSSDEKKVKECLQKIKVYHFDGGNEILCTLQSLYLEEFKSKDKPKLLVVDSLGSLQNILSQTEKKQEGFFLSIPKFLIHLARKYNVTIVACKYKPSNSKSEYDYLSKSWDQATQYKIQLHRTNQNFFVGIGNFAINFQFIVKQESTKLTFK